MGSNGGDFALPLSHLADRYGWAILAPTMPYQDFRDPDRVRADGQLLPRLRSLIEALPERTGVNFDPKVSLIGFSRGSQEAHRFAFMYPETTAAVAGVAAGSYTLPVSRVRTSGVDQALPYPFGTADVEKICGRAFDPEAAKRVRFWIAVGGADNRTEDVPRQWDSLVGTNRVERAKTFVGHLQGVGTQATLAVYPSVDHEMTEQMREDAFRFLASAQ
jgi:pimeloyl-ACP methyl ester carboxylesterase